MDGMLSPDLVTKILESLPILEIIRACCVSPLIRQASQNVRNLRIDDSSRGSLDQRAGLGYPRAQCKRFERNLRRAVRSFRVITRFTLELGNVRYYSNRNIRRCLGRVLRRTVVEMHLVIPHLRQVMLPRALFTSLFLRVLDLEAVDRADVKPKVISIPEDLDVDLPLLEEISLRSVRLKNHMSLLRLLAGCPILSILRLEYVLSFGLIEISSARLFRLEILSHFLFAPYQLVLRTPRLRVLSLEGVMATDAVMDELHQLGEAAEINVNARGWYIS